MKLRFNQNGMLARLVAFSSVLAGAASLGIAQVSTYPVLHVLSSSEGTYLRGNLVQGGDGNIYGTCGLGGANGFGSIVRFSQTGSFQVMSNVPSPTQIPTGLTQLVDGSLYGVFEIDSSSHYGSIFQAAPDGSSYTERLIFPFPDGVFQEPMTLGANSVLFGSTWPEGVNGQFVSGTLFVYGPSDNTFRTLYSFGPATYGDYAPADGSLLWVPSKFVLGAGSLYGTTFGGGAAGIGTFFRLVYGVGGVTTFTTLHEFGGADGSAPNNGLVELADGNLYGTTFAGGAGNLGEVFQATPDGAITVLHSFAGSDGQSPVAGLYDAGGGLLYGTCWKGGLYGHGTVFVMNSDGSGFKTIHDFTEAEVGAPATPLVRASNGSLYGAGEQGIDGNGQSMVYAIDRTPPNLTAQCSPTSAKSNPRKTVTVTVSGLVSDELSGLDPSSLTYDVLDTLAGTHMDGVYSANADGTYSFKFLLPLFAPKKTDHTYVITVFAKDKEGNVAGKQTTFTVHG